jgi:hypothetical protein
VVAVLSVTLERLDVGRVVDVVDIRGVLLGRDTADFAGATLKRERDMDEVLAPTVDPTDLLTVVCDRTELAEDFGLTLPLVPELREERVDLDS